MQAPLGEGPRLYVGGIAEDISEDELQEHFNKWGAVVDIYFPGKKGQRRVNYCFVTFDHWRAAQRACNESERNINGKVGGTSAADAGHANRLLYTPCTGDASRLFARPARSRSPQPANKHVYIVLASLLYHPTHIRLQAATLLSSTAS